ncbi:replicative DNA helicase / cell division control protein 21 /MCM [Corchorus capsularis]|uniref:Replicative DNA helicase / cell division control protein 21 /MCM n=1 Tax=Corchorus capsularis TaxID=210143 RepID=A0A1R3IQC8_COCAP|nr:replicative DNA helicase / cell division control protein 21 /MCM [Corchorus capsularis]
MIELKAFSVLYFLFFNKSSLKQDARNLLEVVTAMEVALEWEREMKRVMEESLWDDESALQDKLQERSTLMADKERMLADIETKEKLFDDFMIFIEAVEIKDLEKAQNFDEKDMKFEMVQILDEESMVVLVETVVSTQAIEGTKGGRGGSEGCNAGGNIGN